MAVKISALPAGSTLDGTELVPLVQGGVTVQMTTADVAGLGGGSPTVTTNQRILGLATGAPAPAAELTASTVLDWLYATQGGFLYRDASGWTGLAPATAGFILQTNGAGANPTWENIDTVLDKITNVQGSMAYRGASVWNPLSPGTAGFTLTTNGGGANPTWTDPYTLVKTTRPLFDHYTDQGNGTTVETDLYSDTTAAGQLAADGDKIAAEYAGIFVGSATATRELKVYFAGNTIFDSTGLVAASNATWTVTVLIIRVSSTFVRYRVDIDAPGLASVVPPSVGELSSLTLSGTNVLKITGQAGAVGAATNDIVAKLGSVSYTPTA